MNHEYDELNECYRDDYSWDSYNSWLNLQTQYEFYMNHEYDELNEICRRPTDQREVMLSR